MAGYDTGKISCLDALEVQPRSYDAAKERHRKAENTTHALYYPPTRPHNSPTQDAIESIVPTL